jgi:WD40 repeat protein
MLYCCAFSPDSKYVATGDRIGHVIVWETSSGSKVSEFDATEMYTWDPKQRRHSIGGIRSLAFSPDGKQIAIGGMGQVGNIDHLEGHARVEVFDWEKKERKHEFGKQAFKGLVEHVEFHPQGDWLLAAGGAGDGFFMFFDLKTGKVIKEEKAPMHIHDILLGEKGESVHAVGHHRMVAWTLS